MPNAALTTLATYLAGEFENAAQAKASPAWYVHLRLWQRPIPRLSSADVFTFLLEQANVISGKPPYRQRILQIRAGDEDGQLLGQYYGLTSPLKYQGAGLDASLVANLSRSELVTLPNSGALIQYQTTPDGYKFQSALKDGELCSFEYGGQRRYVYLGFDIAPHSDSLLLQTYDKGIDPDTGRGLWGALMGPFQMIKQKAFPLDA
ncbi:MAG: chromophore lyase CpcT/CpeT [Cyanobacteria bacterium P01_F01_bin.3]